MTQVTVEQAIEIGWQHLRSGRLPDAENVFRQILTVHPNHPDAIHLLGVVALQVGKSDIAIDLIGQAVRLNPAQGFYYSSLGQAMNLARRFDEAIPVLERAVELRPDLVQAAVNLGNAYLAKKRFDDAISQYRRAIAIDPALAEPHNNLGNALRSAGRHEQAINAYREATLRDPTLADAYYNLAIVLKDLKRLPEAIAALEKAIELRPDYAAAYNHLGNIHHSLGEFPRAELLFRKAIEYPSDLANAYNNLGNAVREQRRFAEAVEHYHRAFQLAPTWALPHYNYAHTLLLHGDFSNGWREHEARRRAPEIEIFIQDFPKPTWDGSDLQGKTILIHAEQGFGDVLQFARYVPMVAQRGGNVLFQCHDELVQLMQSLHGALQILPRSRPPPEFDVHCPLLTLPMIFETNSIEAIPATVPYLFAEPQKREHWKRRLSGLGDQFKIGLVWAGRPIPVGRSVSLRAYASLAEIPGTAFVSLQFGEAAAQVKNSPDGMSILDASDQLKNFTDTSALLDGLDLLITIDTAAAHLSGAMGKPTWVLLPWMPDWRWLMEREDSPWYPTMKLYRQHVRGDFQTPIARMRSDLEMLLRERARG